MLATKEFRVSLQKHSRRGVVEVKHSDLVLMVLPAFNHDTVGVFPPLSVPFTAQNSVTSEPDSTVVSHGFITKSGATPLRPEIRGKISITYDMK